MIELSSTEVTTIGFKINVEGNVEPPTSRFFIRISDDFSIMFPAKVFEDKAIVNVPALSFLTSFKESQLIAWLEVLVDNSYFIPWQGEVSLRTPVKVAATIDSNNLELKRDKIKSFVSAEVDMQTAYESKKKISKERALDINEDSFSSFVKKKGLE